MPQSSYHTPGRARPPGGLLARFARPIRQIFAFRPNSDEWIGRITELIQQREHGRGPVGAVLLLAGRLAVARPFPRIASPTTCKRHASPSAESSPTSKWEESRPFWEESTTRGTNPQLLGRIRWSSRREEPIRFGKNPQLWGRYALGSSHLGKTLVGFGKIRASRHPGKLPRHQHVTRGRIACHIVLFTSPLLARL